MEPRDRTMAERGGKREAAVALSLSLLRGAVLFVAVPPSVSVPGAAPQVVIAIMPQNLNRNSFLRPQSVASNGAEYLASITAANRTVITPQVLCRTS